MNYDSPELRDRLAGEYVLGTMPIRTRRRFERLIEGDATLAALVATWTERLGPLDDATPAVAPPGHVWAAIERRVAADAPPPPVAQLKTHGLAFWRGLAVAAVAACAGLVLYIALSPAPAPKIVAVLADTSGAPGWVVLAGPRPSEVSIAAATALTGDANHSFELWGIAGGVPRPLGLLSPDRDHPLRLAAAIVPAKGDALAVSIEPVGGSPTGLPTGAVLYQGKVLASLP